MKKIILVKKETKYRAIYPLNIYFKKERNRDDIGSPFPNATSTLQKDPHRLVYIYCAVAPLVE